MLSITALVCLSLLPAALPDPNPARMKADLEHLCSPELTGRETGTQGCTLAASYVAEQMRTWKLAPIVTGGLGGATPYHYTWTYQGAYRAPGTFPPRLLAQDPATDIVGVIPGGDARLAGEYVFVTAHFDHLGTSWNDWYPGADDNASGTAGLLEIMRLLRDAHPRRSIALLAVSGEEEGLLGSEAFLANPPLPLATIKADLNMDMIGRGRKGELHVMPARQEGYVTTLTRNARTIAARHHLPLAAGIDQHWQQSDHYSFARRDIPCICFNTGLHEDYHQPTDTPDKIDYGKLAAAVKIIRDLALTTANEDKPPTVLPPAEWQAWVWAPFESR